MREWLLLASNVGLLCGAALILATVQTSLWFQIFGWFPSPIFWMPVLVYAALHRSFVQMAILTFALSLILMPMTVMPESLLFFTLFALGLSSRIVKRRFYWAGASYFMMMAGLAALFFNLYHWLGTFALTDYEATRPEISDWLIQALLTPLVAPVLYELFRWFDRATEQEQPSEASANTI